MHKKQNEYHLFGFGQINSCILSIGITLQSLFEILNAFFDLLLFDITIHLSFIKEWIRGSSCCEGIGIIGNQVQGFVIAINGLCVVVLFGMLDACLNSIQ